MLPQFRDHPLVRESAQGNRVIKNVMLSEVEASDSVPASQALGPIPRLPAKSVDPSAGSG